MAGYTKAKVVTERDQALMRFIGEGGVATLDQLHRRHWPNAQVQTARDRLSQLEKAGWIKSQPVSAGGRGNEIAFTITKKGAALFPKSEAERFYIGLPSQGELKQQLTGQDARIQLERQLAERGERLLYWKNEREIRSEFYREQAAYNKKYGYAHNKQHWGKPSIDDIADAQATIIDRDGNEHTISIEIDGQYYGKMLDKKIAAFAKYGGGGSGSTHNLWVTTSNRAGRVGAALSAHSHIDLMVLS
jgi:DNA-binding PadR family transcriptional regulator